MFARNLMLISIIAVLYAGAPAVHGQASVPTVQVKNVVEQVLGILRADGVQSTDRRTQLRNAIAPAFDFAIMARSILAVEWKKATPPQQQRFTELLQMLLEDTYITAMQDYAGQTVRYGKEQVRGKTATVETFIVNGAKEIPVHYRLSGGDDGWRATDVAVEGVSLVNNYRSSFRSIIRRDGVDGLIEKLEQKLAG